MRLLPLLFALLAACGLSYGDEPTPQTSAIDKNKNGFIEADELGERHQRRLEDPKNMRERRESGELPKPPQGKGQRG